MEIEVIAHEPLQVMGEVVETIRIRQKVAGLSLDAWLNGRGEMLRQELPLGVVALRQSEEEARWGMAGEAGISLTEAVEIPVAALDPPPGARQRLAYRVELGRDAPVTLDRPPGQTFQGDRLVRTLETMGAGLPLPVPRGAFSVPGLSDALRADPVVQADHPEIRRAGAEIVAGATDTLTAARRIADHLHTVVKFERRGGIPSALETLHALAGDCTETSVLFAALARGAGVPTRIVFGLVYKATPTPRLAWHAWNEVRVADDWLSVDATWGQLPVDVGHIALVAGQWSQQAELLAVMRRLRMVPLPAD